MKSGLTKISDILGDFHVIQKPDLRGEPRTAPSLRTKVTSSFPRIPINKQAAMIIAKAPWWAKLDPSLHPSSISTKSKPETSEDGRISILKSQVTNLNNIINKLKLLNENLRKENESKAELVSSMESELAECRRKIDIAKKTLPFL